MTDTDLAKLEFRTEDGEVETLWAKPVGGHLYRVDNGPFHGYGISWNDIVEAEPQPGAFPLFRRVVEKSGHRTVRVVVSGPDQLERVTRGLQELGCTFEGAWSKVLSVDIPPQVEMEAVRSFLISGEYEWAC
jgi:hypothetical protein